MQTWRQLELLFSSTFDIEIYDIMFVQTELHGLAALQWSICQDSLRRFVICSSLIFQGFKQVLMKCLSLSVTRVVKEFMLKNSSSPKRRKRKREWCFALFSYAFYKGNNILNTDMSITFCSHAHIPYSLSHDLLFLTILKYNGAKTQEC